MFFDMSVAEHSLSYLLRNSGEVLEEVASRDVVLQRRDGEDLYLTALSRERGVRDSLSVLARLLRAALADEHGRETAGRWLTDELPWTTFLPIADREEFLDDFSQTAIACVELENYEPLVRALRGWKATAEAYANVDVTERLHDRRRGPAVALKPPRSARAKR